VVIGLEHGLSVQSTPNSTLSLPSLPSKHMATSSVETAGPAHLPATSPRHSGEKMASGEASATVGSDLSSLLSLLGLRYYASDTRQGAQPD
jgi:hypothetical protein